MKKSLNFGLQWKLFWLRKKNLMSDRQDKIIHISYINSLMREINGLTDDIYEDLVDQDVRGLHDSANALIITLKDVIKSHDLPKD